MEQKTKISKKKNIILFTKKENRKCNQYDINSKHL
jgi:hypothetical protein